MRRKRKTQHKEKQHSQDCWCRQCDPIGRGLGIAMVAMTAVLGVWAVILAVWKLT